MGTHAVRPTTAITMLVLAETSRHPKPAIQTPMPFDSSMRIVDIRGRGHPVSRSGATISARTNDAPTPTAIDAAEAIASAYRSPAAPQPRHRDDEVGGALRHAQHAVEQRVLQAGQQRR